jgi:hypothetical protein
VAALAATVRCSSLSAVGFAEDEIDIIRAVDAYRHFDFSANAEHPMLAKLAAFGSVEAAHLWNALAPHVHLATIAPETALRLPMAVAGALTTVALFLLAQRFFGLAVATWAGFLWAVDVNAIAVNRTAKEDTLLVFFLLAAAWLYERGKHVGQRDPVRAQRSYAASGGAFGLMLASKYMPGYFGIHAIFNTITDRTPGENYPHRRPFYVALALMFAAGNFGLLWPASWHHIMVYLHGNTVVHHGYRFAHRLYVNEIDATPWGVPWRYYFVYLATKVPLLVLAAFLMGVVRMVRHGDNRGLVFARVFLVFFLLPYSLMASKFVRYMLPLFAIVDLLAAVGIVWFLEAVARRSAGMARRWVPAAGLILMLSFAASPMFAVAASAPTFGLYQNAIGARIAPPGYFFTDDEFNDAGVREAVAAIARVARAGDVVLSDAEGVVAEYLTLDGRPDLHARSLWRDPLPKPPAEIWVIVQDGHVYFENEATVDLIRRQFSLWREFRAGGVVAVQVFRLEGERPAVGIVGQHTAE